MLCVPLIPLKAAAGAFRGSKQKRVTPYTVASARDGEYTEPTSP